MRILWIDPWYATVWFWVIELIDTEWEVVDYWAITTSPDDKISDRYLQIYDDLNTLIEEFNPNVVAIEELFFSKNVTTGLAVAEARWIMRLLCAQLWLTVYEYKPNEIKFAMTGYWSADKIQVQKMMQNLLSLSSRPKPDDAADALAVALTCWFDKVSI